MPEETISDIADTLDESGKPPKRRIKSAKQLNAIHARFRQDDEQSARVRTVAQGWIDGLPPYNEADLKARGRADVFNHNFGEAKAELMAAVAPYADILDNVNQIADIQLRNDDPIEATEKSRIVSAHWDWMLRQWDGYFNEMQRLSMLYVRDAVVTAAFRDERTWMWEPVMLGDFLTERDTPTDDQRIEVATIYRKVAPSRLYGYIRNPSAAKETGWNVKAVKKAIFESRKDTAKSNSEESFWEEFQRQIKEHDIHTDSAHNKVPLIYGIVKEFDGKISTMISSPNCEDDLLCARYSKFDSINNVAVLFFYNTGTHGTFHSVRGLAHDIYQSVPSSNEVLCRMIELAKVDGIQALRGTPESIQDFQYLQVGQFALLDNAFEPVQLTQPGASSRLMPAYNIMQQTRSNHLGSYQSHARSPDTGGYRSATEARQEMLKESVLSSAAMTAFYVPYSRLQREKYRRATAAALSAKDEGGELAKDFIERCRKDGVTIAEMRDFESVTAVRAIGNGSPGMRDDARRSLIELSAGFDEPGKRLALQEAVAAIPGVSRQAARAYVPSAPPRETVDHEMAETENALFRLGQNMPVGPSQNHVAHLSKHFPMLLEIIEALKGQQMDEREALTMLMPAVANTTDHVVLLSENALRQVEAGEMRKRLQNVTAFVNQLEQRVTEQMMAEQRDMQAQAGEQPDPQQMLDMQTQQLKVQEQQEKARANRELHEQKMEQIRANMQLTDLKAARAMAVDSASRPPGRPTMAG